MTVAHRSKAEQLTGDAYAADWAGAVLLNRVSVLDMQPNRFEADVPPDVIYAQDVPVDEQQVQELRASIKKEAAEGRGTGQQMPVLLAHVPEFAEGLPIIDGFHRIKAMQHLGQPAVRAVIRLQSTWEDVNTQRIANTTKHDAVKFARLVDWIQKAWQETPWAAETTAQQAFRRAVKSNPARDPERAAAIEAWMQEKAEAWQLEPSTIWQYLRVASIADPTVVQQAREIKSRRTPGLTPRHVRSIAEALPGEENFPMQRIVAQTIQESGRKITYRQAKELANFIKTIKDPQEAAQLLKANLDNLLQIPTPEARIRRTIEVDTTRKLAEAEAAAARVIEAATEEAKIIKKRATTTANQIRKAASEEASETLQKARAEADEIKAATIAEAQREAKYTKAAARRDASYSRTEAGRQALNDETVKELEEVTAHNEVLRKALFDQHLMLTIHTIEAAILRSNLTDRDEARELLRHFKRARPELVEAAEEYFSNAAPGLFDDFTPEFVPDPGKDSYAQKVADTLLHFSDDERRVIMLSVFAGLPALTIARILNQETKETRDLRQSADHKVTYRSRQVNTKPPHTSRVA